MILDINANSLKDKSEQYNKNIQEIKWMNMHL